jgi:hypothetical protein
VVSGPMGSGKISLAATSPKSASVTLPGRWASAGAQRLVAARDREG